jgi:prepilin peptidase CpaA
MLLFAMLATTLSMRVIASDLYARRVPNRWLLGALLLGALLLAWLAMHQGIASIAPHAAGLLLGLCSLLPFYVMRWMGAGDVKFFAVLGFLLGWQALLPVWIGASLLAGVHAVAVYSWRSLRLYLPLRLTLLQHNAAQHRALAPALHQLQQARGGRQGIPYAAYLGLTSIGWIAWTLLGGAQ